MSNLLHQRCQTHPGTAMNDATIKSHLQQVSGWVLHDGSIEKTFSFQNYLETISFVNALAWICNTEDHHPDLHVTYDRCVVRFNTHSVNGISINDFICAARADSLVSFVA